jgi:hypothetical protein
MRKYDMQAILRDVKTLGSATKYDYFPSTPVAGSNSNYEANPFPAKETHIGGFAFRPEQGAEISRDNLEALNEGFVSVKVGQTIVAKFPLEHALGAELRSFHDTTNEFCVPTFKGKVMLAENIVVDDSVKLSVTLEFNSASDLPAIPLHCDLYVVQKDVA